MKAVLVFLAINMTFGCKTLEDSWTTSEEYSDNYQLLNYQKTYSCPPAEVYSPSSEAEVSIVVKKAIEAGKTVMAGTKGFRSQIDAACTDKDQIQITTENLKDITIDEASMLATAQAGVTLGELSEALAAKNLSINMISEGVFFTVGGMLGSGTHGSTLKQGASLQEYVTAITIIDGLGEVRKVQDATDLKALRVNLGVLGVVVDATFKVEPLTKVRASFVDKKDDQLAADILKLAEDNYSASVAWFPGQSSYTATLYNKVSIQTEGDAVNAQAHVDEGSLKAFKEIFKIAHSGQTGNMGCLLAAIRKGLRAKSYFTQDGQNIADPVGYSHKMQYFTCSKDSPCPWDVLPIVIGGISIPVDDLGDWVEEVRKIHKSYSNIISPVCFPLNGIYFRFANSSDALVASNEGRKTVFIDLEYAVNTHNSVQEGEKIVIKSYPQHFQVYQEIMHMSLNTFKARPHWGKNYADAFFNIGKVQYDKWDSFLEAKQKFDRNGIFTNNWWNRVISSSTDSSEFKDGCGLSGDCICQEDSHCLEPYKCKQGQGYDKIRVCRP